METNIKQRLQRKFYSKLITLIGISGIGIYSLIHIDDAPYFLLSFLNSIVFFIYFAEGVGRVKRRIKNLK